MDLRTLALLFLFALPATAQEATSNISTSFYAFAYAPGHESVQLPTGGVGFEKLRLSTANIVGPVTCEISDGKLTIHSEPVTSGDGKTVYPVISTGTIKGDMKKALVVLFPAPEGSSEKYKCLVFDHNLANFPLGSYRLINLSNKPIRGAVGREIVTAKPGGITNLELKGEQGTIAPVRFEFFENKRWNVLTETRAAVRKDRRWLMCIYQDAVTGRMNIRSIPDRTLPAKPAVP